ncbi:hypothetical protein B0I35DRAFT_447669 [Stachybotrys elegans]|uniref:PD-(D/E)XK nuclease-like domain-containing protein n=1 Tax=Stachybotrys elegans TaxID=80388 RepID=A0A8K0S7J5_9HYPO|nr:hypothetical protein B0I35DRAFT_447669 [Stachybotrys elegans]
MHPDAIHAWIQTTVTTSPSHDPAFPTEGPRRIIDDASLNKAKCRPIRYSMSSPSKRQRLEVVPDDTFSDPEKTPRRIQRQGTRVDTTDDVFERPAHSFSHGERPPPPEQSGSSASPSIAPASVFTDILASRPHFATAAMDQRPHSTRSSASSLQRPRSTSPSKQLRKMADLLTLDRPVRFKKEMDMRAALPSDVQDLYDALVLAEHGEGILPPTLADIPGMNVRDIRPYMWQQADKATNTQSAGAGTQSSDRSVVDKHHRILGIVKLSNESSDLHRSETAWNIMVHYPLLCELTSFSSVRVEPITSAQIVPAFRPSFSGQPSDEESSQKTGSIFSSTSSISGYDSNASPSRMNATRSVHKMVDFALILAPDEDLKALIETFTKSSPTATVNQTAYYPLKSRPAPVFIETKTSAGNIEAANVQLGVWIAAWHESLRSIMRLGGSAERIITLPIIQVVEGVWTLMFAVDAQTEIVSFLLRLSHTVKLNPVSIFSIETFESATAARFTGCTNSRLLSLQS